MSQQQVRGEQLTEAAVASPADSGPSPPPTAAATAAAASRSPVGASERSLPTERRTLGSDNSALLAAIAKAREYLDESRGADENSNSDGESSESRSEAIHGVDRPPPGRPDEDITQPRRGQQEDGYSGEAYPDAEAQDPCRSAHVGLPPSQAVGDHDMTRNIKLPAGSTTGGAGIKDVQTRDECSEMFGEDQRQQQQTGDPQQQQQPEQQSHASPDEAAERQTQPGWLSFF